tara:strand:+ start:4637 stop:4996 length:360 start_codon:yes stop_codon:yes gene_type:complete
VHQVAAAYEGLPEHSPESEMLYIDMCQTRYAKRADSESIPKNALFDLLGEELLKIDSAWKVGTPVSTAVQLGWVRPAKQLLETLVMMHLGMSEGAQGDRWTALATRDWFRSIGLAPLLP